MAAVETVSVHFFFENLLSQNDTNVKSIFSINYIYKLLFYTWNSKGAVYDFWVCVRLN